MHSSNHALSRINTTVAASPSSAITTTQNPPNVTHLSMSLDIPSSTHTATSFHSSMATFQPVSFNVENHALAAAGANLVSSAHFPAHSDASSVQRAAISSQTHVLTLPTRLQQSYDGVTPVDTHSKNLSIITTDPREVVKLFLAPSTASIPSKRKRPGAATPLLSEANKAENEMTELLGTINRGENPHFLPLQYNLLQGYMETIGSQVMGQALSATTVDALAARLVKVTSDRTLQELKENVRALPLHASIDTITGKTPALPPAVAAPEASTSTTTPQNKRKVKNTPKAAKRSQHAAITDDGLELRAGEDDKSWVRRLLGQGLSDDRIRTITGYSSDFVRYSGYFVEPNAKLAQAQAIKENLRLNAGDKTTKEFAVELDQHTLHLELSNQEKCALHVHNERQLRKWQIIQNPRKMAIEARNITDLTGCKTELEKAKLIKATNPKLNIVDLLGVTKATEEELNADPLFWDLTKAGRHALANVKRREFNAGQPGEDDAEEDNEDFAIRLMKMYNGTPGMPKLTNRDIRLLTGLSRSSMRGLCKLQEDTERTKALRDRYPRNGRKRLAWAIDIHHQDESVSVQELSIIVQLNTWVISKHRDFLPWTPEAREAEANVPRGNRNRYKYALYLHEQRPGMTAKEISRVSGYPVTSMRKRKIARGEFAALFGDKFSPMYYPGVKKRAAERRAKEAGVTAVTAVVSATEVGTTPAATILSSVNMDITMPSTSTAVPPVTTALGQGDFDENYVGFTPPLAMLAPPPDAIHMTSPAASPDDDEMEDWIVQLHDLPSCLSAVFEENVSEEMSTSLPVLSGLSPLLDAEQAMSIPEVMPPSLPVLSDLSSILGGGEAMEIADLQQLPPPGATAWRPSNHEAGVLAEVLLRKEGAVNNHPVNWILDMLVAAPEWPAGFVLEVTDQRNNRNIRRLFPNPDHHPASNVKVISLISTRDVTVNNVASAYWELNRQDQDGPERTIPENNDSLFEAIRQGFEEHRYFGFSVAYQRHALADEWISHPENWLENADSAYLQRVLEKSKNNMPPQKYDELGPESPDQ